MLEWKAIDQHWEAIIGEFKYGAGVRFTLAHGVESFRGEWQLIVEMRNPSGLWPTMLDSDNPTRYFHLLESAKAEASALADLILRRVQKSCCPS